MNNILSERHRRLESLSCKQSICGCNMMVCLPISEYLIKNLRQSTHSYIKDCLRTYFKKDFTQGVEIEDFTESYQEELHSLPNVTPNGLVMCKSDVVNSYNKILSVASDIIQDLGLHNSCKSIHYPVNVRLRWGIPDPHILDRPRASTKWHTDLWAGESSDNVTIHIPISGNFIDNGMGFMETPDTFFPKYLKSLFDYDDAEGLISDEREYNIDMEIGYAYLVDSFLLHKTRYGHPSFRSILSFHLRPEEKLSSSIYKGEEVREENYMPSSEWVKLGKEIFVSTNEKMKPYTSGDVTQNRYAGVYDLLDKDEYKLRHHG